MPTPNEVFDYTGAIYSAPFTESGPQREAAKELMLINFGNQLAVATTVAQVAAAGSDFASAMEQLVGI